ncbi:Uncharacterized protein FKW44_016838 [Caligus rogercresseyi]|uniref:Uncharacterized protein n=1 Tax=Caligus rogercresseyi TaxID=217165 RepID=A0A7T8K0Q0_CALRO|nr:Uncharacterized protein FKW44_016838 [Caligus rogercresseyi]
METDCMVPLRLVYKVSNPDFRSYFLIRIKLARTVNDIHGDLLSTFSDSCPGLSTLHRWHTEFDKGVFALEKKTRPGRPRETRTEENVARASEVLSRPPEAVPGPRGGLSGVSSVSPGQVLVLLGFGGAEASLGGAHGGPVLDPPCETDSEEDDDSDGVHLQAEAGIDHCTTCRDHNRPEHNDRVPEDDWEALSQPEKGQDLAERLSPHVGQCTFPHFHRYQEFLARRDVEPVKQSPYSPDLNLCDRFLLRKLKHLLREDEFGGHEEATLTVQRAMRRVSKDELNDHLRKLRGHYHYVIVVEGDYVY